MNKIPEIDSLCIQDYGWLNTGNGFDCTSIKFEIVGSETWYKCFNVNGEEFRNINGKFVIMIDYK